MKISIITVCFNSQQTIKATIKSVLNQSYKQVEYIIIDGASTDNTIKIINEFSNSIDVFVSEGDAGIYDAINKGITKSSGDVVDFRLYDDSGLLRTVPYVEAKVAEWNAVTRKLAVNDVTDLDPDRINLETGNVDVNDFDIVLVVGQTSGAKWTSFASGQRPKSFDDAQVIQDEFNKIKVYDPIDANPFGFY